MKDIKIIIVVGLFILILGIFIYQHITINKLKNQVHLNHDTIYNQFLHTKKTLMDSVKINQKVLSQLTQDIKKLKGTLLIQEPQYYQMTPQEMDQYMSHIIEKYKNE